MKSGAILILAAVVAMEMVATPMAQAGDSEWATAGKVLAGAAALHVFSGSSNRHHKDVYVEQHVYRSRGHHQPKRYSSSSSCGTSRRVTTYTSRHNNHGHSRRHVKVDRCDGCHRVRSQCRCGPVVISLCEDRRVYQPRIRGHVAYIQERRSCDDRWVTVRSCASIW
ncbi:MAG: hypothetical protein OSB41_11080 [Kiritimatiellae bacterium]|nr:hypothetical protein [Kiritimatiellia bacterium]